jgi:membrane protein YqaA with SNARE-associated domain
MDDMVVPLAGIEPALLAESDFESDASTNSAIGARDKADGADIERATAQGQSAPLVLSSLAPRGRNGESHRRRHRGGLYVAAHNTGPGMNNSLYSRVRSLAESAHAERALAAVAFAESSFFPVPPDVLLAPMALANPRRAWRYALIATIASVVGGMLGYAIGAMLYGTVGQWLINLYGYGAKMEALKQTYAEWGGLVILVKGVTPIPYKLVTIVSGLLGYNFPLFVALSAVTRGVRFFLVAGVLHWFGEPLRTALERNFAAALAGFVVLVIAGFVIAIKVF